WAWWVLVVLAACKGKPDCDKYAAHVAEIGTAGMPADELERKKKSVEFAARESCTKGDVSASNASCVIAAATMDEIRKCEGLEPLAKSSAAKPTITPPSDKPAGPSSTADCDRYAERVAQLGTANEATPDAERARTLAAIAKRDCTSGDRSPAEVQCTIAAKTVDDMLKCQTGSKRASARVNRKGFSVALPAGWTAKTDKDGSERGVASWAERSGRGVHLARQGRTAWHRERRRVPRDRGAGGEE